MNTISNKELQINKNEERNIKINYNNIISIINIILLITIIILLIKINKKIK